MSKQCERPSCKEIAIAAYFLDSAELMMTLENYVPVDGMQVNGLCRRHADALVVPRGWRIEDKRENVPRLFPVTPPAEKPKSTVVKKVDSKKSRVKPPRPSIFDEMKTDKKLEEVVVPIVEVELEETKANRGVHNLIRLTTWAVCCVLRVACLVARSILMTLSRHLVRR